MSKQFGLKLTEGQQVLDKLSPCVELFLQKEAKKIMVSPVMPASIKKDLLGYALKCGNAGAEEEKFLFAMVDAGRSEVIPQVLEDYKSLLLTANNQIEGRLIVPSEIDSATAQKWSDVIGEVVGKKISLNIQVDPSILGGAIVDLHHMKIDLSLSSIVNKVTDLKFA